MFVGSSNKLKKSYFKLQLFIFCTNFWFDEFQKLIGQLHQEVAAEYVRRLLKGQVKLKDKERQLKAYVTVKDNAESLHDLFVRMVRI